VQREKTRGRSAAWQAVIVGLLLLAFCLGLPQFHYTVAVMIAAILKHKDKSGSIYEISWPSAARLERPR